MARQDVVLLLVELGAEHGDRLSHVDVATLTVTGNLGVALACPLLGGALGLARGPNTQGSRSALLSVALLAVFVDPYLDVDRLMTLGSVQGG
jgi:hypothetical protein